MTSVKKREDSSSVLSKSNLLVPVLVSVLVPALANPFAKPCDLTQLLPSLVKKAHRARALKRPKARRGVGDPKGEGRKPGEARRICRKSLHSTRPPALLC